MNIIVFIDFLVHFFQSRVQDAIFKLIFHSADWESNIDAFQNLTNKVAINSTAVHILTEFYVSNSKQNSHFSAKTKLALSENNSLILSLRVLIFLLAYAHKEPNPNR